MLNSFFTYNQGLIIFFNRCYFNKHISKYTIFEFIKMQKFSSFQRAKKKVKFIVFNDQLFYESYLKESIKTIILFTASTGSTCIFLK